MRVDNPPITDVSDRSSLTNRHWSAATIGPLGSGRVSGSSLPVAKFVSVAIWIIVASSCFVMVEPAPYDLLLFALATLLFATGLRVPSELGSTLLLAAIFIIANIVSIIVARESISQPFGVMTFYAGVTVYLLLCYVLVAALVAESEGSLLEVIWNAWIVAAVIAALLGVLSFFSLIPGSELFMSFGRAKGAFKDANVFGPFLIPAALILLSWFKLAEIGRRLLYFLVFMLLAVGLFLSFSRGAWANFLVSLFVFACLHTATLRSLKQYTAAALVATLLLLAAVAALSLVESAPEVRQILEKRASLVQSYDVQTGGRFWVQREALTSVVETPLGIGPNRTETYFGRNPHNVYIKTFVENGWLGGFSFLALLAIILLQGLRAATLEGPFRDSAIVIFASLTGIVAESMVIDTLHWRHLFLLLGMMSGVTVLIRRRRRDWQYNAQNLQIRYQNPRLELPR